MVLILLIPPRERKGSSIFWHLWTVSWDWPIGIRRKWSSIPVWNFNDVSTERKEATDVEPWMENGQTWQVDAKVHVPCNWTCCWMQVKRKMFLTISNCADLVSSALLEVYLNRGHSLVIIGKSATSPSGPSFVPFSPFHCAYSNSPHDPT